jgi:hypothetical protein
MCVTKLVLTSGSGGRAAGRRCPASGNTFGSLYRVLRGSSRGALRSVDRECAGRNAISVKGSSPDKQDLPWWPSQYEEAKATSNATRTLSRVALRVLAERGQRLAFDTTGVQDHGMYTRPAAERERSARGRITAIRPRSRVEGQGFKSKSVRQFPRQKSDALVVARKWGNAHGAKGRTACGRETEGSADPRRRVTTASAPLIAINSVRATARRARERLVIRRHARSSRGFRFQHKPKSRMREIRKSGSVRSAGRQRPAFT